MSATIFIIAIDWVMKQTTKDKNRGIRWTLFSSLEDIDFADDLALLAHSHQHMQEKTSLLSSYGQQIGLKISLKKSEMMTLNIENPSPILIDNDSIKSTEKFLYLGSTVASNGGADKDISRRLNKARNTFRLLNNVWKMKEYSIKTKIKIYQSCVLSTLLYGSECWRMTDSDLSKLSSFHTKSLRRILGIFWPNKIANLNLLQKCNIDHMPDIILKRRWRWIGHLLRREEGCVSKIALHWTPEGKRRRGRPRTTWRRTVEAELRDWGETWSSVRKKATDRDKWRSFIAALHVKRHSGQ